MIKKHPRIRELYGTDVNTLYWTIASVVFQFASAVLISLYDPSWLLLIVLAYAVGGTVTHSIMLAVHETSHNLALPKAWQNTCLLYFANLPIPVAYSLYVCFSIHV